MDMQKKNAVSMLIVEIDLGLKDPQSLARISLRGTAEIFASNAPGYNAAKSLYIKRFTGSENLFSSDDFNLWRIAPKGGRYVAGMANAFNLVPSMLKTVSSLIDE